MKNLTIFLVVFSVFVYSCSSGKKPDKNAGAYYTGNYRNLFLENGHNINVILLILPTICRLCRSSVEHTCTFFT